MAKDSHAHSSVELRGLGHSSPHAFALASRNHKDQEEEIALKEPPFCGVPVYRTGLLTQRPD